MTTDDDMDELDENDPDYLSEEDFDYYNEIENEAESEKLNRVIEKYRLKEHLNEEEMQVLYDVWEATSVAEFMIDAGSSISVKTDNPMGHLHERSTSSAEQNFLAARQHLFAMPGWMSLGPSVQEAVCNELFTIRFDEHG